MKKRTIFCFVTLLIIASCVIVVKFATPSKSVYNTNPDLSSKIVGSNNYAFDRLPANTVDDLVDGSDLIIIGEVIDDGIEGTFNIFGDEKKAQAFKEKYGENPYWPTTTVRIKVHKIIAGEIGEKDEIQYLQLGKPNIPDLQTKVKKSQKLVMILRNSDKEGIYYANKAERSIFYIDEENNLTSMADDMICARYDGISIKILEKDLIQTEYVKDKLQYEENIKKSFDSK
ncbi:MAG: hypothetical protein E7388_02890 [Ruminococcaceae bacterium]|nr:hypothetical protein [Oscillospiraceae bacterium]